MGERAVLHVEPLQVGEHAREHLPPRGARHQRRLERYVAVFLAGQQRPAVLLGEHGAAVEGVDDQPALGRAGRAVPHAHQEVPGEVDALRAQAGTPGGLDVDDRQRDGDADAAIEHLVEATVPHVRIAVAIAAEAEFAVQAVVHGFDAGVHRPVGAGRLRHALEGLVADGVEFGQVGMWVETRVLDGGNGQRP